MKIRIKMTHEDIKSAKAQVKSGKFPEHTCPIKQALARIGAEHNFQVREVWLTHAEIRMNNKGRYLNIALPPKAMDFIEKFDRELPVRPIVFDIDTDAIY